MKITILPKTTLGRWSVGLVVIFMLLHFLFLFGPFLRWAIGIAASAIGLIGIMRKGERSILVFLTVIIAPLVFLLFMFALVSGG